MKHLILRHNIPTHLKRVVGMYLVGFLLIIFTTAAYYFLSPFTVIVSIIILTFTISHTLPLWLQFGIKGKPYTGEYQKRLWLMAERHGVSLYNIYIIPSTVTNAYAIGFASTTSVVFHSNTLENHPWKEIEAAMVHELGHHKNKDLYLYTVVIALTLIGGGWIITQLANHSSEFVRLSLYLTAMLLPVVLAISRWRERHADAYAKRVLSHPEHFADFFRRLIYFEEKKGDIIPRQVNLFRKLLHPHPWIYDRIAYLEPASLSEKRLLSP